MTDLEDDRKLFGNTANQANQWMVHVHTYNTMTDPNRGHQHVFLGVSRPAKRDRRSHVHRLCSRTSFSGSGSVGLHWHSYDLMTDTEVDLPDGTHIHYFSGRTSINAGHSHTFAGSVSLSYDTVTFGNRPEDEEREE